MEYFIIITVILFQLYVFIKTLIRSDQIQSILSKHEASYSLENSTNALNPNSLLLSSKHKSKIGNFIISKINKYLENHYIKNKIPDLFKVEEIIKNEATILDNKTGAYSNLPIIIGLGGTIAGIIFAFSHYSPGENEDLIELISSSAKIVFFSGFCGILFSIFSNIRVSNAREVRDENVNILLAYIYSHLSPNLPTSKDESTSIVVEALSNFNSVYFENITKYTESLKAVLNLIESIHDKGFEKIIEKNSIILQKTIEYIDKLDQLNETTKKVNIRNELISKFITKTDNFVESSNNIVSSLELSTGLYKDIVKSYGNLEERINTSVLSISQDRKLIGDLPKALNDFIGDTEVRLRAITDFATKFDEEIKKSSNNYLYQFNELGKSLKANIENNLNADDYKSFLDNIANIYLSLQKEKEIISTLSSNINFLNEKIDKQVQKLQIVEEVISDFKNVLKAELPKSIDSSLKIARDTITNLPPRSFGELIYHRMFKRGKKRRLKG